MQHFLAYASGYEVRVNSEFQHYTQGINRCSSTVPVRPSDAVLLDEGFALGLVLSSFGRQSAKATPRSLY